MTAGLDDEASVRMQFSVWGFALTGGMLETAALVCEGHPELVSGGAWDRRAGGLTGELTGRGAELYRPVKDFARLPWVAEHCRRGHAEWPGL